MRRIEPVIKRLDSFVVKSLFTFIKPDWNKGKHCETLAKNFDFHSENIPFIIKTGKDFGVYVPKAKRLENEIPPFSSPEEIENQNRENAGAVIIAKADYSENIAHNDGYCGNKNSCKSFSVLCFFVYPDKPEAY